MALLITVVVAGNFERSYLDQAWKLIWKLLTFGNTRLFFSGHPLIKHQIKWTLWSAGFSKPNTVWGFLSVDCGKTNIAEFSSGTKSHLVSSKWFSKFLYVVDQSYEAVCFILQKATASKENHVLLETEDALSVVFTTRFVLLTT